MNEKLLLLHCTGCDRKWSWPTLKRNAEIRLGENVESNGKLIFFQFGFLDRHAFLTSQQIISLTTLCMFTAISALLALKSLNLKKCIHQNYCPQCVRSDIHTRKISTNNVTRFYSRQGSRLSERTGCPLEKQGPFVFEDTPSFTGQTS